ncbi:hypothetical protein DSO57_1037923 [Entomophthora muscae]|uniref:Uncharacterized protein n=1 Tax=Entomophthora muscae TaxID=34485 RepID=A0ACC2TXH0_9FUNG|nr:hypothetical protein DSO57_1037923 [Entomophthora muscae]
MLILPPFFDCSLYRLIVFVNFPLCKESQEFRVFPSNVSRAPLPELQVSDLVIYHQNCIGGGAHKLDSLWVGPCEVTYKKGVEYIIKLLFSGQPFSQVHSKFFLKYQLPVANLEGGDVRNCAVCAILIWS